MKLSTCCSLLLPVTTAALISSCSTGRQDLGTAPRRPISSITDLSNTSASDPNPGIKHKPVKIDTGIDPNADRYGH